MAIYDSGDIEAFFKAAIRNKLNVFLTGATGSGKTSMGKTLTEVIDRNERIITVEDAMELVVPQPNHVRLLYTSGGPVGPLDLLKACLRMRPDRILLQEMRDPAAAWAFIRSVTTGHAGSLSTLHGGDAKEAYISLVNMMKGSDEGRSFTDSTLKAMLAEPIDIIAPFLKRGNTYDIGKLWFRGEAARRGKDATELLGDD